jgi:hypothetical protein
MFDTSQAIVIFIIRESTIAFSLHMLHLLPEQNGLMQSMLQLLSPEYWRKEDMRDITECKLEIVQSGWDAELIEQSQMTNDCVSLSHRLLCGMQGWFFCDASPSDRTKDRTDDRSEGVNRARPKSKVIPIQIRPGKKKGTNNVFMRQLEVNAESGVIIEHSDVLWSISICYFIWG